MQVVYDDYEAFSGDLKASFSDAVTFGVGVLVVIQMLFRQKLEFTND
jgi:hypothetical protein